MHFELFDLRLFVCVAEESNLRRGAERACLSLPAASARIKQMEESLGTPLLYRKPQGVEMTPAGLALLHHARRVLQQVQHLECELREYVAGAKGHVRLLANTTSIAGPLPQALAGFLAQHPGVNIDLRERLSNEIVLAVNESHADIGIVAGDVDMQGLVVRDFASDELVVVVPIGHPLAQQRVDQPQRTRFADTLDEPHVSLHEGSALANFLPPRAHALGRTLNFRLQVSSFESICLLVEAGAGIGIIPRSSALRHARTLRLAVVALDDAWARREIKIISRSGIALPQLALDLIEHLAHAAPPPPQATPD